MPQKRASGIVLHVSSLPNPYGIGTFGGSAYEFVDFLRQSGQQYWQILPLAPTGYGNSPYQSCSALALNPFFIDLDMLRRDGLLDFDQYAYVNFGQDLDYVDFGSLYSARFEVLKLALPAGVKKYAAEFEAFRAENAGWLKDYALFMAVKQNFNMVPLSKWPDTDLRARKPDSMRAYAEQLSGETQFYEFLQFLCFKQWTELKAYANENGVKIIGDIPIYCAEDSAEVWAQRKLFLMDADGSPKAVAGVPPDLYSSTGQLWGNPLYDWAYHEKTGFEWWIKRFEHTIKLYDVVRIDHFRGFESYWEVPAGETVAVKGKWRKGPAMRFINAIRSALPDLDIIAEDLGDLDEDVRMFLRETGLPGMTLLVDAFDPDTESDFLPHNVKKNSVAYTSTHDSPTFMDFYYNEASQEARDFAHDYMRLNQSEGFNWGAVKAAWGSPAYLSMAPMQDILALGEDARMNKPSTQGGRNWQWRVRSDAFNVSVAEILHHITKTYKRYCPVEVEKEQGGE